MKNFVLFCIVAFALFMFLEKSTFLKKKSVPGNDNLGNKIEIISFAGEDVYLSEHLVKGGITIFDFYADWCGPCRSISKKLEPYVKNTRGVYLKKINIKDWNSPVVKNYQINSIPSIWIYNKNGEEVKTKINSFEELKRIADKL